MSMPRSQATARVQLAGLVEVRLAAPVQVRLAALLQSAAAVLSPQQHRPPRRVSEKLGDLTHRSSLFLLCEQGGGVLETDCYNLSGKRMMNPSRFGIFTFGSVFAFISS